MIYAILLIMMAVVIIFGVKFNDYLKKAYIPVEMSILMFILYTVGVSGFIVWLGAYLFEYFKGI